MRNSLPLNSVPYSGQRGKPVHTGQQVVEDQAGQPGEGEQWKETRE